MSLSDEPVVESQVTETTESEERGQGVPLWMPLVGLVIALAVALFIGVRIIPTLSALVSPPDPPRPPAPATLMLHEAKGTGLDEFLYGTETSGCEVARYYEKLLGDCTYDPDSRCQLPGGGPLVVPGSSAGVARCEGKQTIGAYNVTWIVYVTTNFTDGGPKTRYRVIREVGN